MSELLLSKLEGLRQTGGGRWLARCPAHNDKSPSLSIRVLDDGRTLVYCFAGCDVSEIVSAAGLTVSDLFPERATTNTARPSQGIRLRPAEALLLLGHEITAAAMLVDSLATVLSAGETPSKVALDRLFLAASRIQRVRSLTDSTTPPEILAIRRGAA